MTAFFALAVALLMALACAGLVTYARLSSERNAQAVLNAAAAKVGRELKDSEEAGDLARYVAEEREDLRPDDLTLLLVGSDGRVLGSSEKFSSVRAPMDGKDWRTARLRSGDKWLVIALPWTKTEGSLRSLVGFLGILGLFVVALATVGAWLLVGRTLSPIGLLSRQAKAATVDNLRVRLEAPSQDAEIVGLVGTLNDLLSRLSETVSAKSRFYSAASHEIRTPLQALYGHLELALARDRTREEYHSTIEEAFRQTRRLTELTRNLLLLYRLDSSGATLPSESSDLSAICREILAQLQPTADQRGLTMATDLPESAAMTAPAAHAEVLVRNLLENAVLYTDANGRVGVKILSKPSRLELHVRNDYTSELEWQSDRLMEPFARLDASRNAATGGTGLGLAICKAIAEVNGWSLALEKEPNAVCATLVIPR